MIAPSHCLIPWPLLRLLLLVSTIFVSRVSAQEDAVDPPEFKAGLVGTVELASGETFQRIDDDILFDWSTSAFDLRIEPGAGFRSKWVGFLECKEPGEYRLHAHFGGRLKIKIDDQEALLGDVSGEASWRESREVKLAFGRHAIEIDYEADAKSAKRLGLYWSAAHFELEPISQRSYSHRPSEATEEFFERGAQLARGLRCNACHIGNDTRKTLAAPSLTHLEGNLQSDWLIERLSAVERVEGSRMPSFGLRREDSQAIAAALFADSKSSSPPKVYRAPPPKKLKKDEQAPRVEPSVEEGRSAFLTRGCLACHQVGEVGNLSLFDGGDLSHVAAKRTPEFFWRWLIEPEKVNGSHRMPVFELESLETADLVQYLQSLNGGRVSDTKAGLNKELVEKGKRLIQKHRCGACHELPSALRGEMQRKSIDGSSRWDAGCLKSCDAESGLPGFSLPDRDIAALKHFWTEAKRGAMIVLAGRQLLEENNCTACHVRDAAGGLSATLAELTKVEPQLAARLAALAPPSLNGVGDKLHDAAIVKVLAGNESARRPWLAVKMPEYRFNAEQMKAIVADLVAHDRIPERPVVEPKLPSDKATELASARLVTSEGFGCQSCHKIGSSEPQKVAIHAQGTDLTKVGDRIRATWFKRWVKNPARIVPRMEMPAIQTAAKGVLGDDLDLQLAALWDRLNADGFEPPRPNPVRVVRNYNQDDLREHANVLTDVLEQRDRKYLRPLIVGLDNRHNLLFDLEKGGLADWWIGDTARQYTRGKSWYWEPGAPSFVDEKETLQQFALLDRSGRQWMPKTENQFVVQFDGLRHIPQGIEWHGRIELWHESESRLVKMTQRIISAGPSSAEVTTSLSVGGDDAAIVVQVPKKKLVREQSLISAKLGEQAQVSWTSAAEMEVTESGSFILKIDDASALIPWTMRLASTLPPDRLNRLETPIPKSQAAEIAVVPGFHGQLLPLPRNEMPTALAWGGAGEMVIASLKGRVYRALDTDADGLEDSFVAISDDFPAPYGLAVNEDSIDVLCKTSLVRLTPAKETQGDDLPYEQSVIADGWGYTADYHDWAVGLERDADGNYYMALPCQQDDRTAAAAKLRGQALKLIPQRSADAARSYRIESIAAGLRFPMGLAMNGSGELFATDNQGNYNPFNELNHLQFGKRYGFINKLEAKPGFAPEFESPAVNLPHPWTRSVNGLCFLQTPETLQSKGNVFGAFEGDLVGCEYNGLSLVRMSLQKVNGQYQGAAYLFSRPSAVGEATFEGPVCCAVSPEGDLYVGSIHDSGWGGGQNTGSIVRLRPSGDLPLGLDEVRATSEGFEILFTQPIDPSLAAQASKYSIRSYRRVSTPAYGGDDQDERSESVVKILVADDLRSVTLELKELRPGHVYEIYVGEIGPAASGLFPNQAHYNMRSVPRN